MRKPKLVYRLPESERRIAEKELNLYIGSLCHDDQFDVRRSVTIIRIMELPHRISINMAIQRLHDMLMLTRARANWGRTWTQRQLERIYYTDPKNFVRRKPHPVTEQEFLGWKPHRPPYTGAVPWQMRRVAKIDRTEL